MTLIVMRMTPLIKFQKLIEIDTYPHMSHIPLLEYSYQSYSLKCDNLIQVLLSSSDVQAQISLKATAWAQLERAHSSSQG